MKNPSFYRILFAGCLLLSLFSCNKANKANKKGGIPQVNYIVVGQGTVPVFTEYVGQTSGKEDIVIQSRVQGWITGIHFKEGQRVEKGSLLYTIDDLPFRTQLDGYKASLAKARTLMVNKKSNLDRVRPLADIKALSTSDLDAAIADYEAAKSEVKISEAQLADIQIQMGYTRIKSPISGIIGITNVDVGDYVGTPNSQGLNTVSSTSNIIVKFPIPENDYLRFIKRMNEDTAFARQLRRLPVQLQMGDGSIYPETGKLELADRQVDPQTGSMLVEAMFTNPHHVLRPGLYVKIRFRTDEFKHAVLVPQEAVNQLQDIYQVFVLNDSNKVVPRIVKTGQRVGNNWIITEGLKPGEKVALIGNAFLNPAHPVNPKEVKWTPDSTIKNQNI